MFRSRKIKISHGRLLDFLHREGCEVEQGNHHKLVIQHPGWDAEVAHVVRRWPFFRDLWDRIEVTRVQEGAVDEHEFKLAYFTRANLLFHGVISSLVLTAALGVSPLHPLQLVLLLLVSNLLLPVAAVIQARDLFRKIEGRQRAFMAD